MQLLRYLKATPALEQGVVVAVGNFDGVHLGHQALLTQLKSVSAALKCPSLVLLFEPQPSEFFKGHDAPARLSTLREKIDKLKRCGIDYVYCMSFNRTLSLMSARDFAERYLFTLKTRYLLIGEDFRFGHNREGDAQFLQYYAQSFGCQVETFSDFIHDNQRVSSTQIRQALSHSQFNQAAALLGEPYHMCGRVMKGNQRGREWGVPTANLVIKRKKLPIAGVFCVNVNLKDGRKIAGVANIGSRPTIDGSKHILEVHLFDFNELIYGEIIRVMFLEKLRDEIKFASLDLLIAQIHEDIKTAKQRHNAYLTE